MAAQNMSELFQMLESNNQEVVKEIKQVIYEQYEEGESTRASSYLVLLYFFPNKARSGL